MKKYLFFIVLISLLSIVTNAQIKVVNLQLERNGEVLQTIGLGESGIIIKTGKNYANSKKLGWKLRHYSSTLDLIWEVPIVKTQINKGFENPIIVSPSGKWTYHIENKGYNTTFGATKKFITLIDNEGKIKTKEFEKTKDFGVLQMTFCNDNSLFFLATENGNENDEKKKATEKLILNRIDNSDLRYKKIVLNLPVIKDPEHTTFWTYIGHDDKKIFLLSKTINTENGQNKFNIITVSSDGEVLDNILIDSLLDKGKYIRPSYNVKLFYGNYQDRDNDFVSVTRTSSKNGITTTSMIHRIGAFGNVIIDSKNGAIYIYGLYGPKPFKKIASVYKGYFIFKYDLKGNEIFKIQNDVSNELSQESYFRLHGAPYDRNLLLKINSDETLDFKIWFKKQVHSYVFSKDGNLTEAYINRFKKYVHFSDIALCSPVSKKNKAEEYLNLVSQNKKNSKKTFYQSFSSNKGVIILEDIPTKLKLNLLFFENN